MLIYIITYLIIYIMNIIFIFNEVYIIMIINDITFVLVKIH